MRCEHIGNLPVNQPWGSVLTLVFSYAIREPRLLCHHNQVVCVRSTRCLDAKFSKSAFLYAFSQVERPLSLRCPLQLVGIRQNVAAAYSVDLQLQTGQRRSKDQITKVLPRAAAFQNIRKSPSSFADNMLICL